MRVGVIIAALAAFILSGCGGAIPSLSQLNSLSDLQNAIKNGLPGSGSSGGGTTGGSSGGTVSGGGSGSTSGGSVSATDQINAMLARHNATRTALGLKPLRLNAKLAIIAQGQAQYNATIGKLNHYDALGHDIGWRATSVGYVWHEIGENIAYGTVTDDTIYQDWLGSSGHYHNIVNPDFVDCGIGVVHSGRDTFWCVDFGTPL